MSSSLTGAERQRRFRERKRSLLLLEVRGVFAHLDDHLAIKRYALKVSSRRARLEASDPASDGLRSRARCFGR